jgi:hypothetical protein
MKKPKTIGELQTAAGLPSDTLRNPSGSNARDDQHVSTFEKRHGKAELGEQLTLARESPDLMDQIHNHLQGVMSEFLKAKTAGDQETIDRIEKEFREWLWVTLTEGKAGVVPPVEVHVRHHHYDDRSPVLGSGPNNPPVRFGGNRN